MYRALALCENGSRRSNGAATRLITHTRRGPLGHEKVLQPVVALAEPLVARLERLDSSASYRAELLRGTVASSVQRPEAIAKQYSADGDAAHLNRLVVEQAKGEERQLWLGREQQAT